MCIRDRSNGYVTVDASGMPLPATVGTTGIEPPAPAVSGGTVQTSQPQAAGDKDRDADKKKRGFWSRVFGRGGGT